ncbi:MAG: recombination protein RecR [Nitrospinota bacterium]|nr:MAG: recombination protein RecR [Nitrospinota bacterium]
MTVYRPRAIRNLIEELKHLPGVGEKTAQRLAFYLLRIPKAEAERLAQAILEAREKIRSCTVCHAITETELCSICSDPQRDRTLLCVVEDPSDIFAIERISEYRGLYHVLLGALSPLEGIGPEDLKIRDLLQRLQEGEVKEVILATNPTLEGEATAMYLSKLIKPLQIRVTRLARGLPIGGDLEYADEVTLLKSLEGRLEI